MSSASRNKTPSPATAAGKKLVQARLPFKKLTTPANPLATVCASPPVSASTKSATGEEKRKRKLSDTADDTVLRAPKVNRTDDPPPAELISLVDSDNELQKDEHCETTQTENKDNCEDVAMKVDAAAVDKKSHDKKKSKSKKKSKEKKLVWDEDEVAESAKAEHCNVSIKIPLPRKRKLSTKKAGAPEGSKTKKSETVTSTEIIEDDSVVIKVDKETTEQTDEAKSVEQSDVEKAKETTEKPDEKAAGDADSVMAQVDVTTNNQPDVENAGTVAAIENITEQRDEMRTSVEATEDSGESAETALPNNEVEDDTAKLKEPKDDDVKNEDEKSSSVNNEASQKVKLANTFTDPDAEATNDANEPVTSHNSSVESIKSSPDSKSSTAQMRNDEEASNLSTKSDDSDDVVEIVDTVADGDSKTDTMTTPKRTAPPVLSKFQTPDNQKLTPKQVKRKLDSEKKQLERQRAKEERDRKLQEEKEQKQREKDEKERQRRKEREDRDEQRRKERDEKEEQKRLEKEDRERKRQSEIDAKNEERRAKEEERRVKEEERKRLAEQKEEERRKKEEEKRLSEEAKNQEKQKQKALFTKFFVVKRSGADADDKADDERQQHNFMPFQVKEDMKLAPTVRRKLAGDRRNALEAAIRDDGAVRPSLADLYLKQLRAGTRAPEADARTLLDDDNSCDVVFVGECTGDELNETNQLIEESKPKQLYRAKFFKFEENRRPPYYGTWRKTSKIINARKPFTVDNTFFDYEVDSDDEWEEEEPGESLNGSEDEKESVDDYDIDNEFFVPHGHLSDEELAKEDETDEDNSPAAQKARLQIVQKEFADEMKKKTEKIKPRLIGLIWQTKEGTKPDAVPPVIWDTLTTRAMMFQGVCVLMRKPIKESDVADADANENDGLDAAKLTTVKRGKYTEETVADLIRLVHGNTNSRHFLALEFRAYLPAKTGAPSNLSGISISKKIKELATYGACSEEGFGKTYCWYVSAEKRKQYGVTDVSMPNTWKYLLKKPKKSVGESGTKDNEAAAAPDTALSMVVDQSADELATSTKPLKTKAVPTNGVSSIAKFTTVLTADEKRRQFEIPTAPDMAAKKSDANGTATNGDQKPKKRVNLLMSGPRGEEISATAKDEAVRKFLNDNPSTSSVANGSKPRSSTPNSSAGIMRFATKLTADEKMKSFAIPAPKSSISVATRKVNVVDAAIGEAKATVKNDAEPASEKPKKRVNLLMSVPCGEEIPVTAKDEAVRKFLAANTSEEKKDPKITDGETGDVIIIE